MTRATLFVMCFAGSALGVPSYDVIDLGTLAGPDASTSPGAVAHGASTDGGVVGVSILGDLVGETSAFRWTGGTLVMLPPLAGDTHSIALDANAKGLVVGQSFDLGDISPRGVVWNEAQIPVDLGELEPVAINDAGVIAARRVLADGAGVRAVRYVEGVATDIPTLGGSWNSAADINGAGDVAGHSYTGSGDVRAFLQPAGGAPIDLGTLGGQNSEARGLNDQRVVVGWSHTPLGETHACRFDVDASGVVSAVVDLGVLTPGDASYASDVNGMTDIVGCSGAIAVLWSGGGVIDLNDRIPADAGWELMDAKSINDAGEIVGFGRHDGLWRAFLLVPKSCDADFNGSGAVDIVDFTIFSMAFGSALGDPNYDAALDFNGTGTIDIVDFTQFALEFGRDDCL